MKKCSVCRNLKELSAFYQRKNHRSGEYYERCKECSKVRGRNYYHANKERQLLLANIRTKKYRDIRKKLVWNAKSRPCADCNKIYPPWVMDLDHRVGVKKLFSISNTFHGSNIIKIEIIENEINKCDVVCSNCHRQRTYDRLHHTAAVAKVVKAGA